MKKIALLGTFLLIGLGVFVGCEKVVQPTGNYREGTYFGSAVDDYNNEQNVATAVLYVGNDGKIKSLTLDTTYKSGEAITTKKTLGDNYNMKKFNPSASGEWYEQIDKLEKAIIEKQEITFLNLDADGKTDAVSGTTIKINALYEAINNALKQAKK